MTEAEEFLEWLRPGGPWVLTAIDPQKKQGIKTVSAGPGEVEPFVRKYDGRFNIYFQVNPTRGPLKVKHTKADIECMEFFHVDVDPRVCEDREAEPERVQAWLEAEQERIRARLEAAKPSGIVFSGGGYQAFWRLKEPIHTGGDVGLAEEAERYNRALEPEFGADSCHNIDRILRLPGTINVLDEMKRAKGRKEGVRASAITLDGGVFDASGFKKAPPKASVVAATVVVGEAPRIEDVAELDKWNVPDRIRVIIVQGNNPDEPKQGDSSRSAWVFDAACGLVRSKVPDEVIFSILTDPGFSISESVLEKGPKSKKYAIRQIRRAHEEVDVGEVGFQTNGKSDKPLANQHNIRVALRKMGCALSYDAFRDKLLINGQHLGNGEGADLRLRIEEQFGFLVNKDYFLDVIAKEARANTFHPVDDYLDDLVWDGVPRVDRWLVEYGGAKDSPYVRAVGSIVLIAAVRRVRSPGCKFDEMLVLEGPQGTNKSSALAVLAVRDDWFSDDLPLNEKSEKTIEALAGKWIVEAGELAGMRKGEVDMLKAFLSRQTERGRLAYARLPVEVPRDSVFIGTTNNDRYLRDSTGNRRFWPVLTDRFDVDRLRADRDQLWAEAAQRESARESIRLAPGLWAEAAAEQEDRRVGDPFADMLREVFGELDGKVPQSVVWDILDLRVEARTPEMGLRVNGVMRELGWTLKQRRFGGGPVGAFVKGESGREVVVWKAHDRWVADYNRPGGTLQDGPYRVA